MLLCTPDRPEPTVYYPQRQRARMRCLVRDNFRCQYPGGCSCRNLLLLTIHHIIPRSAGGTNDLANLQTLCQYHHALVHDSLPKRRPVPTQPAPMIKITIDAILRAVVVERDGQQHVYSPSPASMHRVLRLTCQPEWVYRPCFQPRMFVWERACVSWRGHETTVQ